MERLHARRQKGSAANIVAWYHCGHVPVAHGQGQVDALVLWGRMQLLLELPHQRRHDKVLNKVALVFGAWQGEEDARVVTTGRKINGKKQKEKKTELDSRTLKKALLTSGSTKAAFFCDTKASWKR